MNKFALVTTLTFSRAPLVACGTALALWNGVRPNASVLAAAMVLLIASGLTDLLDGKLARKWCVTSRLGALADPLMDKIFYLFTLPAATFLALRSGDEAHAWMLLALDIVSLARDQWASFLRSVGSEFNADVKASFSGKLRTFLCFPGLTFVHLQLGLAGLTYTARDGLRNSALAVEAILAFVTLVSFWTYTKRFWPYLRRAARPKG